MIKNFNVTNLDEVMKIWIETNIDAHNFVPKEYWINNFEMVKEMLPSSELYIYEDNNIIKGFIGVSEGNYIAGIFVKKEYQRDGIGKKLIVFCKERYSYLTLEVFTKNKKAINFYMKNGFSIIEEKVNDDTKEREYKMCYRKEL